jgi:UDPglucose--hexose-1-phosphate uridylyltransferase
MSLLRYDVTTNDWVVFAPQRARRLQADVKNHAATASDAAREVCPFCPGNERLTGPEIYADHTGTGVGRVRVVANKFPALRIEENERRLEEGPLFRSMGGCGAHEVIIESPDHKLSLARQPVEQIERLLCALQARFNDLMRDSRFQTIVIFKNHGEKAGTSLRHPHWQLIATPVVPRLLRLKHATATDYFDQTGHCLYCEILQDELTVAERVLISTDDFAAILPYASHIPFETWILPRIHYASFGHADARQLRALAVTLKTVLLKLELGLENPDYNLAVHTAPRGDEDKKYFLWHMQILPRLTTPAGFELGSGMAMNTVMPEQAARYLRDVSI